MDFTAVMSLYQSPLATSSGVGSSGWAMLPRRQDTIKYGCDGGCDNNGLHKGLVFTVIVMYSVSSFHYSAFSLFSLLTSWWLRFRWFLLWSDTLRRVRKDTDNYFHRSDF